jgi:histidyl-tRNA synthetase
MTITPQTLKGFRDFLPRQMAVRNRVISTLKQVFESYGFSELMTPTLEYAAVLQGKYGQEAERLMYLFTDQGGRQVGLKYDLTVPLARVMAQHPDLPLPFKRYQIQPAFRAENPQKSRYREFYQCDIDTVGSVSPVADAEILAITSDCLTALGFSDFTIRINSRRILAAITDSPAVLQSIDKLDKKTPDEVKQELVEKGLNKDQITDLFALLDSLEPDADLKTIMDFAIKLGAKNLQFDPRLVRGLDYYTGSIFETIVTEPKVGSLTGGGRYDQLIKSLGGPDLPAVGTTIGLDRVCDVITDLNLWPDLSPTSTQILVTIFSPELLDKSLQLSTQLRQSGGGVELYPDPRIKLDSQLKYAAAKSIPFVAILGPEEAERNMVKIKDMKSGEQKLFKIEALKIEELIAN